MSAPITDKELQRAHKLLKEQAQSPNIKLKRQFKSDGKKSGLLLEYNPNGSIYFIARYWENGKEKRKQIGTYPQTSLKQAREIALRYKYGYVTPEDNQQSKCKFAELAAAWYESETGSMAKLTRIALDVTLNKYILPALGEYAADDITTAQLTELCESVEKLGYFERAKKIKTALNQIFTYAKGHGYIPAEKYNPAFEVKTHNRKAINYVFLETKEEQAELLRKINIFPSLFTRTAFYMVAYVGCRQHLARSAEWSEIDLEKATWSVPASKTKTRAAYTTYLPAQLVKMLKEIKALGLCSKYIFCSDTSTDGFISDSTMRSALRGMGYQGQPRNVDEIAHDKEQGTKRMTLHGFRAMASTIYNTHKFLPDAVEKQLQHKDKDAIRAIYNRAEYTEIRSKMVQWYADYLDSLRDEKETPELPKGCTIGR